MKKTSRSEKKEIMEEKCGKMEKINRDYKVKRKMMKER